MAKFLETITSLDNDVLVPINKILYVNGINTDNGYWEIVIKGKGKLEWTECFPDEKSYKKRYEMIKEILEAK